MQSRKPITSYLSVEDHHKLMNIIKAYNYKVLDDYSKGINIAHIIRRALFEFMDKNEHLLDK